MEVITAAVVAVPALLLLIGLWRHPEWGLLLYGVALGFPDLALSSGAINLRIEDALIAVYALRLVLIPVVPLSPGQRSILAWQLAFAGACLVSALTAIVRGYDQYFLYVLAKLVGCVVAVVVLPTVIDSPRRLRFLAAGLMVGGGALVLQMVLRLAAASPGSIVTFQDLKYSATPTSWNPNTLGQAATLLAFGAAVGAAAGPGRRIVNRIYFALGHAFAAIPVAIFSRGAVLGLCAGYAVFTTLTGRVKVLLVAVALAAAAGSYYLASLPPGVAAATYVDVRTGEGLSGRYERWAFAVGLISERPLLGHGFGQELAVFEEGFGFAVAHNSFLSAWIELGVAGPLLLAGVIVSYVRAALAIKARGAAPDHGAAVLALLIALVVQGLGNSSLYWDKQPAIALAVALAVVGIAERTPLRVRDSAPSAVSPLRSSRRPVMSPSSTVPAWR